MKVKNKTQCKQTEAAPASNRNSDCESGNCDAKECVEPVGKLDVFIKHCGYDGRDVVFEGVATGPSAVGQSYVYRKVKTGDFMLWSGIAGFTELAPGSWDFAISFQTNLGWVTSSCNATIDGNGLTNLHFVEGVPVCLQTAVEWGMQACPN